jgi:hypothetical protein
MKLATLLTAALTVFVANAVAQDNPTLAKYDKYRFDADCTLYQHNEPVRTFTLDPAEQAGERAMFSPHGRFLVFDFKNQFGGHGLHIYNITRDRMHKYLANEATIAKFDWFEYTDSEFVIYSTDFNSEETPAMSVIDPHTGRAIFRGEGMAYGFLQDGARGITYFRYVSPDQPVRGALLSFDEMFTGILFDINWRTEEERQKDFYILAPSRAKVSIEARHNKVLEALVSGDLEAIAAAVHPDAGVRISLDGHISEEVDLVFSRKQVQSAATDETSHLLGTADGTGEPIYDTLEGHIRRIGGLDYKNADATGYNRVIGRGNTINNVFEYFRDAIVVEYYWGGTEKYAGMDWHSVRLVYARGSDNWYVVGIVEDRWTI